MTRRAANRHRFLGKSTSRAKLPILSSFPRQGTFGVRSSEERRRQRLDGLHAARTCGPVLRPQKKARKRRLDGLRAPRTCGPTVGRFCAAKKKKGMQQTDGRPATRNHGPTVSLRWAREKRGGRAQASRAAVQRQQGCLLLRPSPKKASQIPCFLDFRWPEPAVTRGNGSLL